MVLRRTVRRRRRWNEALAGGGPSIPPPSTCKSRHSRAATPAQGPETLFEASVVCQGHEAAVSDHDVVDDGDAYRTAHRAELLRDRTILG